MEPPDRSGPGSLVIHAMTRAFDSNSNILRMCMTDIHGFITVSPAKMK
jgi:hypothetical protein